LVGMIGWRSGAMEARGVLLSFSMAIPTTHIDFVSWPNGSFPRQQFLGIERRRR
jgi:hypothetical protein